MSTLFAANRRTDRRCVPVRLRRLFSFFHFHGIAFGVLAILLSTSISAEPYKNPVLLELFTSQGCSSCPPADALLSKLSKRPNVVALTLPVSYWDYLGWKDTLAKSAFVERQYAYANARGDRQVYTPQVVVNGVAHVVGSQAHAIDDAIASTEEMLSEAAVALSAKWQGQAVQIEVGRAPEGSQHQSGKLWLACYRQSVPVSIGRGENSGRRITYTNVVRELVTVSRWTGEPLNKTVKIPPDFSLDEVAVFLQSDQSRAILGVAMASR